MSTASQAATSYRVIDALDHPHGGRILRLRLRRGKALTAGKLKSKPLVATSPEGEDLPIRVIGFALFGGKPGDARLAHTGRVDVKVAGDRSGSVEVGWIVRVRAQPGGGSPRIPGGSRSKAILNHST